MSIRNRVVRLETGSPGIFPIPNRVGDCTDDQLAYLITGDPDTKASELSDDYLARATAVITANNRQPGDPDIKASELFLSSAAGLHRTDG